MIAKSLNPREAYGQALVELGAKRRDVVALEADLGKSTRSELFKEAFPDRYFQMGIAEQNMAAAAAGFALAGKLPFIHSFAVFASGRTYDQLRNSICIPNLPVRICGSSAGLSDFGDGKTHQAVEDMAILRALPNMTVLCPADAEETALMVAALGDLPGPAYIRVNRNDVPIVCAAGDDYRIGVPQKIKDGGDAVIFACGVMVGRALDAAKSLASRGISVKVVNVSTLKPLDRQRIIEESRGMRAIVTAEEHTIIGGLGSAVAEALRAENHAPIEFVGIEDRFGISARNYEEILQYFGLTASALEEAVERLLNRKRS